MLTFSIEPFLTPQNSATLRPLDFGELHWKTCLRHLILSPNSSGSQKDQQAYESLLKIVCGLESPIVGETEVMGQFKKFVFSLPAHHILRSVLERIYTDAKSIRNLYLKNLGSQTYGSLCRRVAAGVDQVHVFGAGQMSQSLWPWLMKDNQKIFAYTRKPSNYSYLNSQIQLGSYGDFQNSQTDAIQKLLVICAPLSSEQVLDHIGTVKNLKIVDLRGESEKDPLSSDQDVMSLKSFFSKIENNSKFIDFKVQQAQLEIQKLSQKWWEGQTHRPFGWEDLHENYQNCL